MRHSEVAKRFAYGHTNGKGSRMFIEGDTIYSHGHHFPIAKRFKGGYLFNTNGYSNSTSKHKSYVLRVLGGKIIHIKNCDLDYSKEQYQDNIKEIERIKDTLTRARVKHMINYHKDKIEFLKKQNEYLMKYAMVTSICEGNEKWN